MSLKTNFLFLYNCCFIITTGYGAAAVSVPRRLSSPVCRVPAGVPLAACAAAARGHSPCRLGLRQNVFPHDCKLLLCDFSIGCMKGASMSHVSAVGQWLTKLTVCSLYHALSYPDLVLVTGMEYLGVK